MGPRLTLPNDGLAYEAAAMAASKKAAADADMLGRLNLTQTGRRGSYHLCAGTTHPVSRE
jgi:hypothetical protein